MSFNKLESWSPEFKKIIYEIGLYQNFDVLHRQIT